MTPQELKNSILQLAIQGKLVEQRPEEGTAEELHQKILLERYKLQQNKKIKKVPDFSIVVDNIPFEIPENWSWSNIEILTYAVGNKENQIQTKEILPEGSLPVVSQGQSLIDGYTNQKEKAIDDLPLVMFGDHTRNVKFIEFPFAIGADGTKFQKCILVYPQYIYYWMTYASGRLRNRGYARHYVLLKEQYIPLPPLAEQKRIVAKIEELLPYIDRYEQAWNKLEDFNKRFPTDMQKSILQMAIQGKLVEQRLEEGTGEELYQQIQAEKQKLIKSRTIKKDKSLPEITEDEKPFEIPDSWKWVSVGYTCTNIQYGTSQKSSQTGKMAVLRMGNIQNGKIDYDNLVYSSCESDIEKYCLNCDDLLFNRTNSKELVGKTAIYKGDIPAIFAGYLVRITPILLDSDYLNYVMQSQFYWTYCQTVRSDAIGQSNINAEKLKRFFFPLPPLAEQQRIVAKLEEILPLCEKLK